MSTLKATNIKNESSASNNIVLDSGGGVVVNNGVTLGTGTTISSPASDTFAVSTNGSERIRVDSSGKVGLGTNVISSKVNVLGTGNGSTGSTGLSDSSVASSLLLRASSNSSTSLALGTRDTGGQYIQGLYDANPVVSLRDIQINPYGGSVGIGTFADAFGGDPGNSTFVVGTSGVERARVDSSGKLLVGTTSARSNTPLGGAPAALIERAADSHGNADLMLVNNSASGYYPKLIFGLSQTSSVGSNALVGPGEGLGYIQFTGNDGSNFIEAARIFAVTDGTPGSNDMPGRLVFSTTADGASSPTERMRISANGDILAGSTSTWATAGSGASFYIHNNSDQQALRVSNGDPGSAPYGLIGFYRNKGSLIARISTDGSTVSYNTSSDYRLKENVTPVTDGITRLQQLKPSRFNFIADPDKTVDGFLAHEAQEIVPECVTGTKDAVDDEGNPIYQGIDQSKLVPLLTAALQELVAEVESLKVEVAALKAQ